MIQKELMLCRYHRFLRLLVRMALRNLLHLLALHHRLHPHDLSFLQHHHCFLEKERLLEYFLNHLPLRVCLRHHHRLIHHYHQH
jgi:hypothetical protein